MSRRYVGLRLRALREARGMAQVDLARRLGISASYLNQIERNQRPLTATVLDRLREQAGIDLPLLAEDEAAQLVGELREVLAEAGARVSVGEAQTLAANMPGVARALVDLQHRARQAQARADTLAALLGDGHEAPPLAGPGQHDAVRDYLNRRANHIAELDEPAERVFQALDCDIGAVAAPLAERLEQRHGLRVATARDVALPAPGVVDADSRTLWLADHLLPGQQAFQMARRLAELELGEQLDALIDAAGFADDESRRLARVGFTNYYAGALVMPYTRFLASAEGLNYDIERLANLYGVGFEAVCHRLSTLQRPDAPGLPFFFVRVDRAGNVSKRHSAADFHFSRVGGSCPLWIVYEAFSRPDEVLTQIAEMPDGRQYFWIARQVVSGASGYGRPRKRFAVGLGCDLRNASRLVYSRGVTLTDPAAATPIGPGCRVCERRDCAQRASPSLLARGA